MRMRLRVESEVKVIIWVWSRVRVRNWIKIRDRVAMCSHAGVYSG